MDNKIWDVQFETWQRLLGSASSNARSAFFHPFSTLRYNSVFIPTTSKHASLQEDQENRLAVLNAWRDCLTGPNFTANLEPFDNLLPNTPWCIGADMAAVEAVLQSTGDKGALASIIVGPVQPFIQAGRSLRDLWTGSSLLSYVAFAALKPILDKYGPSAVIMPSLRGNLLMDDWLRSQKCEVSPGTLMGSNRAVGIPHRLLALVPYGENGESAEALIRCCADAAFEALQEISDAVRERIGKKLKGRFPGWDNRWNDQISSMLNITGLALPLSSDALTLEKLLGRRSDDLWEGHAELAALVRDLGEKNSPKELKDCLNSQWPAHFALLGKLAGAARAASPMPEPGKKREQSHCSAEKCTLLGSWEQMGPVERAEANQFWQVMHDEVQFGGVRLRKSERFCAQSLVKRFAMPSGLQAKLALNVETGGSQVLSDRFPDTATVAAWDWLNAAGLDWQRLLASGEQWSGQWLYHDDASESPPSSKTRQALDHARRRSKKNNLGEPPTYYAIIVCDGDNMGQWLAGKNAPSLGEHLQRMDKNADIKRPPTATWQTSLSAALSDFATALVPAIVARHSGTLIYAGGDDVMAVLPAKRAIACARELRWAFSGVCDPIAWPENKSRNEGWVRFEGDRERLTLGPKASLSAGLCIVHAKNDLREALGQARLAEAQAKESGRDSLGLTAMRRSGEHSTAVMTWADTHWFEDLISAFGKGQTSTWAYQLRNLVPTFKGCVPEEAVFSEIRRQVDRSEFVASIGGRQDEQTPGQQIASCYRSYLRYREKRDEDFATNLAVTSFEQFLILCQAASFIQRGRD